MTVKKRSTVVGLFHDRAQAEAAVKDVQARGFAENQLGILTRDKHNHSFQMADMGTKIEAGAVGGALAGAGIGTLAGVAVAAGLMTPLGPAVAGGILASVLSSAGLGAAAGSIIGALIGLGVPEDEARYYEQEFEAGRTIVVVKAGGRYEEAWQCLRAHGAYDMKTPRQRVVAASAVRDQRAPAQPSGLHDRHDERDSGGQLSGRASDVDDRDSLPMD